MSVPRVSGGDCRRAMDKGRVAVQHIILSETDSLGIGDGQPGRPGFGLWGDLCRRRDLFANRRGDLPAAGAAGANADTTLAGVSCRAAGIEAGRSATEWRAGVISRTGSTILILRNSVVELADADAQFGGGSRSISVVPFQDAEDRLPFDILQRQGLGCVRGGR